MVTKFSFRECGSLVESENGRWVEFDDHQRELREALDRATFYRTLSDGYSNAINLLNQEIARANKSFESYKQAFEEVKSLSKSKVDSIDDDVSLDIFSETLAKVKEELQVSERARSSAEYELSEIKDKLRMILSGEEI